MLPDVLLKIGLLTIEELGRLVRGVNREEGGKWKAVKPENYELGGF